ncbi:Doublesex- and mab-3-related transcription factor A2 [Bienertia sinuspersici]
MSAIVCGKRTYFEELPATSSTPVSKKLRCSSSSPVRFSPFLPPSPPSRSSLIEKLSEVFPLMDRQLLDQALEECGDDIDAAIKRLHELCLGSSEENKDSSNHVEVHVEQGGLSAEEQAIPPANSSAQNNLPTDGTQWVELFVTEMMSATSVDDARGRAAKVLEVLEKSIRTQATAETADNYQKENNMLKQQIQALMQDNGILKRGIQIQHERQKEFDDKNQEVQQLKELLSQYQEQLRRLEV